MAELLGGKSAIITGGGSGIGRAAALILNMRYRLIEPEQDDQPPSDPSPEDARLLEEYLQRHARGGERHE